MGRRANPISLRLIQGNQSRLTKKEIEALQKAENKLKPETEKTSLRPGWIISNFK